MAEGLAEGCQLGAQLGLGRHGGGIHPLGDCLQVEAAAPRQERQGLAGQFGVELGLGDGAEFLQVERLVWIAQIQQLVAGLGPLGGGGLGGAHIHLAVELARIHVQHRQIQGPCQGDRQVGLAAGRGAEQHNHQRLVGGHGHTLAGGVQPGWRW